MGTKREYKHITFSKRDLKKEWPRELLLAYAEGFRDVPREFIEIAREILWLGTPWLNHQDAWWAGAVPESLYRSARIPAIVSLALKLAQTMDAETLGKPWYTSGLEFKITREYSPALYVKGRDVDYLKRLVQKVKAAKIKVDEVDTLPAGRYSLEKEKPPGFLSLPATRFWWD